MVAFQEHHQLKFPPIPGMEIEASRVASSIAEKRHMSLDKVDDVSMAVVEAFLGALERGESKDRTITLTVDVLGDAENETLQITVRDTGPAARGAGATAHDAGPGYAAGQPGPNKSRDNLTPLQKHGFGLKLIERLMDETQITSDCQGTTITMSKHCH